MQWDRPGIGTVRRGVWQHRRNSRLRGVNVAQSYFRRIAASAVILAALPAVPAFAQGVLEEVVVSAQKREQNIQDVGISMSAFTGDQLKALGVEESFDIAAFTPGVHISGNLAGQNTQFTIRGVTQNDFNDIVEAPNAVYLDEGYIAVAQAQTFGVYDIDRVEVLKGPQGTLFGRNATACRGTPLMPSSSVPVRPAATWRHGSPKVASAF
jgi:outer membrane receptor protein involved in Fe transport